VDGAALQPGRAVTGPDDVADAVLARCVRGELSPTMALMQLLLASSDLDALRATLDGLAARAADDPAARATVARLRALLEENCEGVSAVATMLRGEIDPAAPAASAEEALARCQGAFDRMVRRSPEASVALYSLGNPEILAAATAEVVARLDAWGLLGAERAVLDIGCGIGRFEPALAPRVAAITGIDVSPAMVETARRRCAGLPNVRLLETSGRDLAAFAAQTFDLVLAVDSFPYLYAAGPDLVAAHVREAARVLRPGGDLVVLNLSYRGDIGADRRDAGRLAAEAGLDVLRSGTREFELWDGLTFHLRRRT
jgi:SAM-dependent methyltransferase